MREGAHICGHHESQMAQRNGVPRRGDDGRCPLGDRGANYTDEYRIPIPSPLPLCGSHLCNLFFNCPKGTHITPLRGTPFRRTIWALPRSGDL